MPKRKVIEDSDNEENAEATPPRQLALVLPETHADTVINPEGSTGANDVHQSADLSTGSTGSLLVLVFTSRGKLTSGRVT